MSEIAEMIRAGAARRGVILDIDQAKQLANFVHHERIGSRVIALTYDRGAVSGYRVDVKHAVAAAFTMSVVALGEARARLVLGMLAFVADVTSTASDLPSDAAALIFWLYARSEPTSETACVDYLTGIGLMESRAVALIGTLETLGVLRRLREANEGPRLELAESVLIRATGVMR